MRDIVIPYAQMPYEIVKPPSKGCYVGSYQWRVNVTYEYSGSDYFDFTDYSSAVNFENQFNYTESIGPPLSNPGYAQAPVLLDNTVHGAWMTLDPSLANQGFWTSGCPPASATPSRFWPAARLRRAPAWRIGHGARSTTPAGSSRGPAALAHRRTSRYRQSHKTTQLRSTGARSRPGFSRRE